MQLPPDLRQALDDVLGTTPSRDVARSAAALSERYREGHARTTEFQHSDTDVAAYAAYRLPATYAAIRSVLEDVRARRPDFEPGSLLDLGGGPGTAAWAAAGIWPSLSHITILDRDPAMLRLGEELARHGDVSALRDATWRTIDITGTWAGAGDLTVAAYLLGELTGEDRTRTVERLWDHTRDTCLLIEPGTPRGYEIVRAATQQLVAAGGRILAPAPHDWTCVESPTDWLHFSIRVPRTRLQRAAKGAEVGYEDEKYTYVAVSRRPGVPIAARVIRQPLIRTGHVHLVLCTARGVVRTVVSKKNREAYRRARDLRWGDALTVEEGHSFGLDAEE